MNCLQKREFQTAEFFFKTRRQRERKEFLKMKRIKTPSSAVQPTKIGTR